MSLDGFSMRPLARELDALLAGGRIDKVTQPSRHSVVLSVRQPGENFLLHISISPQNPSAHILKTPLENPKEPPVFCMVLRKQLETGRIASIRQHGLDRLLFIDVDSIAAGRIVTRTLALELMGKYSNIILIEDGRILDALRKVGTNSSRVRTVLPGDEYVLPPGQEKLDLFETPIADILARIQKEPSESRLDKAILAACLGFGPVTVKEVCFSAGLAPSIHLEALDAADFQAIGEALGEVREAAKDPAPVLLMDEHKKILAMAAFPLHYLPNAAVLPFETVSALLERADSLYGSYVLPDKERLQKFIKNELNKAQNKLVKIEAEIEEADSAEVYRVRGDNLQTYRYNFRDRVDASITVPNIYSETGETIEIPLDQRLTLVENMQAAYKKYDKLKRGRIIMEGQLKECAEHIKYLESVEASLESSESLAEIDEIHTELVTGGILYEKVRKKSGGKQAKPFSFRAPDGTEILIGKNNYQNDRLTFKTARPRDLWLHAKDIPGSHVILRTDGIEPSEETLLLAAKLAAHFSKAKGSSNVPVDYVEARRVKKPAGAKPGFVIFTEQRTLYVTPDEKELLPILAAEGK